MKKKTSAAKTSRSRTASPENKVSDAGWKILSVLWERGPCIASQIESSLKSRTGWSRGAVRSFLSRLVSYGIIRQLDDEPISRFEAAFDRNALLAREVDDLLEKCGADLCELLTVHFESKRPDAETVRNLKALLTRYERKR